MIIQFACPSHATDLIQRGLKVFEHLYECEVFNKAQSILRCDSCQLFGHIRSNCSGHVRCSKCAGSHSKSQCDATFQCCVLCYGPHQSAKGNCPVKTAVRQNLTLSEQGSSILESNVSRSSETIPLGRDELTVPLASGSITQAGLVAFGSCFTTSAALLQNFWLENGSAHSTLALFCSADPPYPL